MHNKYSVWDEPGVMEALTEIAAIKKYSAAEIAIMLSKRFNVSISRNAVIGRMARTNIALRHKKGRPALASLYTKPPTKGATQAKEPKPVKVDPNEPKPLGDVPCGCRWLWGDATHRNFCGAPVVEYGSSWCGFHSKRVWNHGPRVKFIPRRAA